MKGTYSIIANSLVLITDSFLFSYRNVATLLLEMAVTGGERGQFPSRPVSADLLRLVNEALDAAELGARRAEEASAIDDAALTRTLQVFFCEIFKRIVYY
jgi:hypothetical protein